MWYTLPWIFDEFFHKYIPDECITKIQVFEKPSQKLMIINQSSLRTLDAVGEALALPISFLPYVGFFDCIETLHLSFWNRPLHIDLPALRNVTLLNSVNCLNNCSKFPTTIRSICILLFYPYPNYMSPNWAMILHSLSILPQLSSLRVFIYDLVKTMDDGNCQMIAKIARLFSDFSFCFRHKFGLWEDDKLIEPPFKDHKKFINQLFNCILLLSSDKQPYYSIENDGCGLTMWF
jgi:hypothetical protein